MEVFVCRSTNQVLLLTDVVRNTWPNFKAKYQMYVYYYYVIGSRMAEVISAIHVQVLTIYHEKATLSDE